MTEHTGEGSLVAQEAPMFVPPKPSFETQLEALLLQHPQRLCTNTPPHVLAKVMIQALDTFEECLMARYAFFNRPTGSENYPHVEPGSSYPG